MCFIRIHKVNSSKYEWSLDLLTVIFDSWIFITNKKWQKVFTLEWIFMYFIRIHQVKSSENEWSLDLLTVIFDNWICHKQKRDKKVLSMKSIHMFFQNLPGEIFKVWKVFKYVGSDLLQLNLYHIHKGVTGFTLE